jgi:hypothetical protein
MNYFEAMQLRNVNYGLQPYVFTECSDDVQGRKLDKYRVRAYNIAQ